MDYKVLIVDDEKPARELLQNYLEKIENVKIIDAVAHPLDAKKIIESQEVDILLSDIQMDDLTGLELVRLLQDPPVIIFTTAYSEYALESFDLDVVDYLVKPISLKRFVKAIDKAIEIIDYRNNQEPKQSASPSSDLSYFFVKTNNKMVKVNKEELLFVESFGEYIKLHTTNDVIVAYQRMSFMEDMLSSDDFIRIHRSHIINLNYVNEIDRNTVVLSGNYRLTISKRLKENFMSLVKKKGVI